MRINFKEISECPPIEKLESTCKKFKEEIVLITESCPEEFQRDEQLTLAWASDLIGSILLKYPLEPITFSRQKDFDTNKTWTGKKIKASYKNLNGLQRGTAIIWFYQGKIKTPPNLNNCVWNDTRISIGGKDINQIRKEYPGFIESRFDNYKIDIKIIGDKKTMCSPTQETFIFTKVLNNTINLTKQMLRQATTYKIAKEIRKYTRLNPVSFFKIYKNKLFASPSNNKKMAFDELGAIIVQTIKTGFNKALVSKTLDELYSNSKLENGVTEYSFDYKKDVNLITYLRIYCNFMYQILKDRKYWKYVDKGTMYSLLAYTHIHIRLGIQNKFDYEKLKKQFWKIHFELVKPPTTGGSSPYRDCLRSNSLERLEIRERLIEEKLKEISPDDLIVGVLTRDSKRSFTPKEIATALHEQGGVCAVDGLPATIDEVVGGHNLAWSLGNPSTTDNCIAIRKKYNDEMGIDSLEQYLKELEKNSLTLDKKSRILTL